MAGDWTSGLGDPDAFEGLPMAASPLNNEGIDPDEARLMGGVGPSSWRQPAQASPTPAVAQAMNGPAAATQQPSPQPLDATASRGLQSEMSTADDLRSAANAMTPDPSISAAQGKLSQDQGTFINPKDPKYKAGLGTRVLRGLRGAALGLAGGGIPGAIVGSLDPGAIPGNKAYSAPTDAYDQAAQAHNRLLTQDESGVASATDNWKRQFDAQKERMTGLNNAGEGYGRAVTGATGQQNAATEADNAATNAVRAGNESPDAKLKLSAGEMSQRAGMFAKYNGPASQRSMYILTGKMPDPRQATAEELATGQALRAFRAENGGREPQTLEEFNKVQSAARGTMDKGAGGAGTDANLRTAARIAAKHLETLQSQKVKYGVQMNADELKAIDADIADAQDESTKATQALTADTAPKPAAAPVAAKPAGAPKPVAKGGGKPVPAGMVRIKLPNGNTGTIAQGKLAAAKAAGATEVTE